MDIQKNKYYNVKANEFCSFGIKVTETKSNQYTGITHFGHIYKFKNDEWEATEITKKEWCNY